LSSSRSLQIAVVTAVMRDAESRLHKPRPNARARSGSEISWREQCEYSAERLSDQFEMRRPVPDVPTVCFSAALVIYPTYAMPIRRAEGQNWN